MLMSILTIYKVFQIKDHSRRELNLIFSTNIMNLFLRQILLLFILVSALLSCNKKKFLDEKPDSQFVTPSTLHDFRALLNNERVMSETPVLGELSSDNYYMSGNFWQNLNTKEKNAYVWAKDIYHGE